MMDGSNHDAENNGGNDISNNNNDNNGGYGIDKTADPLASVELDHQNDYQDPNDRIAIMRSRFMKLKDTKISDVQFPLFLIAASSIILLIAVCTWEGEVVSFGYSVSVPVVSFVLSFLGIAVSHFRETVYQDNGKYLAHFLFLWNFAGASWMTFNSPFITTGNGYFAAWASVGASAMAMGITADAFKDRVKGLGSMMGCFASSIILILSSIEYVGQDNTPMRGPAVFAMVLSSLTIALIVLVMVLKKRGFDGIQYDYHKFMLMCAFSFMWFVCACHVTFKGPFVTTGNGYFSVWAGCGCIMFATFNSKKEISIAQDEMVRNSISSSIPPENATDLSDDI